MHIPPGRDMHQTGHSYPHRLEVLIMWRILYVYIYDRCEEVPVLFGLRLNQFALCVVSRWIILLTTERHCIIVTADRFASNIQIFNMARSGKKPKPESSASSSASDSDEDASSSGQIPKKSKKE